MSTITSLVATLKHYQNLNHHHHPDLLQMMIMVQDWQITHTKNTHQSLFYNHRTAPLAQYLVEQIYHHHTFKALADQLLTASNKALEGSGRLTKLVPNNALTAGVMGIKLAVATVELDLKLAQAILTNHYWHTHALSVGLDYNIIANAYQLANPKNDRIAHIHAIAQTCQYCYEHFNSFLLHKALALAKTQAYHHGYQTLYDCIYQGLTALKPLKTIAEFTTPFMHQELIALEQLYRPTTA